MDYYMYYNYCKEKWKCKNLEYMNLLIPIGRRDQVFPYDIPWTIQTYIAYIFMSLCVYVYTCLSVCPLSHTHTHKKEKYMCHKKHIPHPSLYLLLFFSWKKLANHLFKDNTVGALQREFNNLKNTVPLQRRRSQFLALTGQLTNVPISRESKTLFWPPSACAWCRYNHRHKIIKHKTMMFKVTLVGPIVTNKGKSMQN